jgi:hypothetical protein
MRAWISPEPELCFGKGQRHVDPKTGLALYGPFVAEGQIGSPLGSVNLGLIGPRRSFSLTESWLGSLGSNIPSSSEDSILFPSFPGFKSVFGSQIQIPSALKLVIPEDELEQVLRITDSRTRVEQAALLYQSRIEHLASLEPKVSVAICSVPREIEETCWSSYQSMTAEQKRMERMRKKKRREGQLFLTDFDEEITPIIVASRRGTNLHSRIKAHAMQFRIPTQLVLETSLAEGASTQPMGTVAWNFAVAMFYKAGGYPWRLAQAHENTCYVGVSFYRERDWDPVTMGTSIAQVFDSSGEGLIIKGARIDWGDARNRRSPHMNKQAARNLVEQVLEAYKGRRGRLPDRIVFHKTTRFWPEELEGMNEALPTDSRKDYLAIERGDIRLIREGNYPPLRGTCIALGDREYLIYGAGYIPYLGTYPGHHVPSPLHVIEHLGDSTPQEACSEILSLTKLNWNTAQYCCGVPITLNIARRVSSILAELPEDYRIDPSYRYYM